MWSRSTTAGRKSKVDSSELVMPGLDPGLHLLTKIRWIAGSGPAMTGLLMAETDGDYDHADIRTSVRALCAKFPGEYWRQLDRERGYPREFVAALTEAGYLAALIPEALGGAGLSLR